MPNRRIFVVPVVYNCAVETVETIHQILRLDHEIIRLIVCDNSSDLKLTVHNQSFCRQKNLEYIAMGGNKGLSKAYNAGIRRARELLPEAGDGWLMTVDDDTHFSDEYFHQLVKSVQQEQSYPVKSGIIYFDQVIGSPVSRAPFRFPVQVGLCTNVDCINSGLVVRLDVLDRIGGYDERLFLDMVDYLLMHRLRMSGYDRVDILGGRIDQNFSGNSFSGYDADFNRFKIHKKDVLAYVEAGGPLLLGGQVLILRRALHLAIHYRRLNFLWA